MIPSLLQIPSAVSDSKLHSVLPNNGKGDFTFDRSTGATRINKDGLIEEVGYFSSELVQNGNFSELGSELIVNGDFATNSDWTATTTDWTISNGKAIYQGTTNANLKQNSILVSGKTHKLVYEVVSNTCDGSLKLMGETVSGGLNISETVGVQTVYFVANGTNPTNFGFRVTGATTGVLEIDNVSVKQVDPNDRWSVGVGWNITDKANFDDTVTSAIYQSGLTLTSGKKYKLTFIISDASGNTSIWIGNSAGSVNYEGGTYRTFANGNHTIVFDMPSDQSTLAFYGNTSGVSFSIDNISLVEVQGDRPRLSYDITNGVVEDKPHLLLEPSSTNLFTFSEDFSQSVWGKSDSQILSVTHKNPDGTTNAKVLAYNGGTNQHYMSLTPSVSSGQDYTFSVFLKAKELKFVCLIFLNDVAGRYFDLENGTLLGTFGSAPDNSKIEHFGNGWYRCSITDSATSTTKLCGIYLSENGTSIGPFTPTNTNGVYIWGAMLEEQSYVTSYIPTAGTTITRAAETCNNSKPSVNSTEGVLYGEINIPENIADNVNVAISNGTNTEIVKFIYLPSTSTLKAEIQGSSNTKAINDTSFVLGSYSKIAILYKSGEFKLYVNGSQIGSTITSHTLPTGLNEVAFDRGDGSVVFYGKVKGLAVYNEALSESQLFQLTGVTASSIYNNFVTRTASFTVEALNEVKKVIDNL